jgi:hypothetical protein
MEREMKSFGEDVDRCLLLQSSKDQELWLARRGDLWNLVFLQWGQVRASKMNNGR